MNPQWQGNGGAMTPPQSTGFQLLPHLNQHTDALAKCIATTNEILRRLRGITPEAAGNQTSKGPETASDFAMTHGDQVRFLSGNIQEIATLIG